MKVFCTDQLKYWLRRTLIKGDEAALLLSDLLPEFADFENDSYLTGRLIRCTTICLWPEQLSVHLTATREIYHEPLIRLEKSIAEKVELMRRGFPNGERSSNFLEEWLNWALNKNFKINWLTYALEEGYFPGIRSRVEAHEPLKRRYLPSVDVDPRILSTLAPSAKQPLEPPILGENNSRREQQHEIILAVIAALQYDPLQIPDGGKAKIKKACLTRPKWFTQESFNHAWKAGTTAGLFRLANHEKYSPS
jgi:hypothetical protein